MVSTNGFFFLMIGFALTVLAESYQNRYIVMEQKVRGNIQKQQIVLGNVNMDYKFKATYERKLHCSLKCKMNEYCLLDEDTEEQSCVCHEGYIPSEHGCYKPRKLCNNNDRNFVQCFIYADTSLTSFDATDYLPIANASTKNCKWMVSSDNCDGLKSKYKVNFKTSLSEGDVIIDHVIMRYVNLKFVLGDELTVNDVIQKLPYKHLPYNIHIERKKSGLYILQTNEFNVRFLKNSILNYGTCHETSCGVCGYLNGDIYSKIEKARDFMFNEGGSCESKFDHKMREEF